MFRRAVSIFNFPENFSFCEHDPGDWLQTKPVIKEPNTLLVTQPSREFKLVKVVPLDQRMWEETIPDIFYFR